jgi:hypothetical protein
MSRPGGIVADEFMRPYARRGLETPSFARQLLSVLHGSFSPRHQDGGCFMARWKEVRRSAPEFAATVQGIFDAHRHKILATLRSDGSPRISGIEATFKDGDLWLGMMEGSRKALDLRRDSRLALHSASLDPPDDPSDWDGDAKMAGRAEEITDPNNAFAEKPDQRFHLFRVDIEEVVLTRVGHPADHLDIEVWREGRDLQRLKRK